MSFGVQYDDSSDLALMLSAVEDRAMAGRASRTIEANPSFTITKGAFDPSDGANHSGGSNFTAEMPLTASMAGLAGLAGANSGAHPAILQKIRELKRYQKQQAGKPYPNVTNERSAGRGYTARTTKAVRGNINKGWNAAAQPASSPGVLEGLQKGFRDVAFGGLSYEEAMNYSPAPLTDQLGALRGGSAFAAVPPPTDHPGTPGANNFATALAVLLGGAFAWWATR
jgi:hypothetical protein